MSVWSKSSNNVGLFNKLSSLFFFISIALLLVGILCGLMFGGVFGNTGYYIVFGFIAIVAMATVIMLRQYELAITLALAVHLYIDWYLGLDFVALLIMIILLSSYFIDQISHFSLKFPDILWMWVLLLLISIIPALRGVTLFDGAYYYFNVIFCAFAMFYLGLAVASDVLNFRLLLKLVSLFSVFIAVITIIQSVTGFLLFGSTRFDTYLASIGNYSIASGSSTFRTGSFLVNPDTSGAFFAITFFIPLGLFFVSSSFLEKAIYLIQVPIILAGLVFSYTTGAWLALGVSCIVFLVFVGGVFDRLLLLAIIVSVAIVTLTIFPAQLVTQLQHAQDPNELLLRVGAWQTGIQVIRAFPLLGLGLGRYVYILRAEPYRVVTQYIPLSHPHNAFLELAALGGIPVALVFITLLLLTFLRALRNWFRSDRKNRTLIATCIASVTALTVYSFSNNGWTSVPLLPLGWLLLGAVATLPKRRLK